MKEIERIYFNDFGMAFYWKEKKQETKPEKIQLVFKETGFYFTLSELNTFVDLIEDSSIKNSYCNECEMKNSCAKFLVKTPCSQIDLAVSMKELNAIKDLVEGTLFKINLEEYINGTGMN